MYGPLLLSLLLPLLPMTLVLSLATTWSLNTILSHSILLHWLALVVLVGSCSVSVLSSLTPQPPLVSRRIDTLLVLLQCKPLVTVLVHVVFACCLSPLISDGELSVLSLYLSLSTSLYFILSLFLKHQYCYDVPDIKLNCMKLLSLNYKSWAKSSLYETFKILKLLIPVYLLFNTCITDLLSMVPGQTSVFPDNTWTGPLLSFLCPSAVYTSVLTVFVTHFLLSFSVQAATAIVNHDLKFVLVSPALVDPRPLLSPSLTSSDVITKALAHHELVKRVQSSAVDRAEIFTLTGGHPVLWHDIYKSWKSLLTTLTDKLNQQSEPTTTPLTAPSSAPKAVIGRSMIGSTGGPNSSFVSHSPATPVPLIKAPVNQFCQTPTPAPRTPLYSVSTPAAAPEPKVYDVNQLTAAVQVIGTTAANTAQDWLYNKLLATSVSLGSKL